MENTKAAKCRVDLVTGFLGAGKTTFIRGYASHLSRLGVGFGIIENEFGMAGVDTQMLIGLDRLSVAELSGGCICCSLKADFARELVNQSQTKQRVIVEPSGVFELDDFFEVMNSPAVSSRLEVGSVIAIADMGMMDMLPPAALDIMARQLLGAGRIVVSKLSGDAQSASDAIRMLLDGYLGMTGAVSPDRVIAKDWKDFTETDYNSVMDCGFTAYAHERIIVDHQSVCNSATLYPRSEYSRKECEAIMDGMTQARCGSVLRVKGYLDSADGGSFILNAAASGRDIAVTPRRLPAMINVIGFNLKRAELQASLNAEQVNVSR